MLVLSRRVLRVMQVLNWVAIAVFAAILLLFVTPLAQIVADGLAKAYGQGNAPALMRAMAAVLVLCIATGIAAHFLFRRMIEIVATAIAGDPFVAANARRLRAVGWALLAIQVIDVAFGAIAMTTDSRLTEPLGWTFSIGGWIAVLMVFVLARVFDEGARMRDELAMTV